MIVPWAAERFASAVIELLQDPEHAAEMGARAGIMSTGIGATRSSPSSRSALIVRA